MLLSREQYYYMSDYIKREYGYSPDWCKKVSSMNDDQIFAIFCRITAAEQRKKHPTRKRTIERVEALKPKDPQISIDEWLKEAANV